MRMITLLSCQNQYSLGYFRQTESGMEEPVNTSMDMSSMLEETEMVERVKEKKKRVEISPLTVTCHPLPSDAEKEEDRVEVMMKEGKVVYTIQGGKEEEPLQKESKSEL